MRGDAAQSKAQKGDLNYHNVVPLGPGVYNVRLAIADGEMKQVGSAFDWIVIPDLKQNALTLSSVFLPKKAKKSRIFTMRSPRPCNREARKRIPANRAQTVAVLQALQARIKPRFPALCV
jgi:hypothetical protein